MRGAAISPSADILRSASARGVGLPTSRMVVMPQASQMFSSYSMGCGFTGALLLQVRMIIDQTRQHVFAGSVDHGIGLQVGARTHLLNDVVLDDDIERATRGCAVAVDDSGVMNQEPTHSLSVVRSLRLGRRRKRRAGGKRKA